MNGRSLINEVFGLRLSRVRRNRRISQAELARAIGKSRATIANIENGNQNVLLHQVYAIARVLDVDILEILPDSREVSLTMPAASDEAFLENARRKLGGIKGEEDEDA